MAGVAGDFPVLARQVHGRRLVYLDNAATTQKPQVVIDAIVRYYTQSNANVHRSVHQLAEEATQLYEGTRAKVAAFINAHPHEIVFAKNTSEVSNLVMHGWGMDRLKAGDEVLLSIAEHHSNIVPWQRLQRKGVVLRYADVDDDGRLDMDSFRAALSSRTKLVCISHASNVLGAINPVKEIVSIAHDAGALVFVDGAQSVPHIPLDVRALDCDFLAFSAHKMLGPTGVGVLYAKRALLESMEPFLFGGEMIKTVSRMQATWNDVPWKFEAGTPNIAGVAAFGAAIDYLNEYGMARFEKEERELVTYAISKLVGIKGLALHGPRDSTDRLAVFSFSLDGIHPHDIASIADSQGVAIRSGHACAQLLMERLGVDAVARASAYIYNTAEDIDALVDAIEKVKKVFA